MRNYKVCILAAGLGSRSFNPDINKALLNNKKLQITDKGLYSITKYYDAKWITDMIILFLKNKNIIISKTSIIDGTAGIGGNTISFSKYFLKVYSIEINNVHYDVLKNNIEALSINNVDIYLDNFLNIMNDDLKSNIFFFDPPWGGKSYKNFNHYS
jgi:predicted RNA methylase